MGYKALLNTTDREYFDIKHQAMTLETDELRAYLVEHFGCKEWMEKGVATIIERLAKVHNFSAIEYLCRAINLDR